VVGGSVLALIAPPPVAASATPSITARSNMMTSPRVSMLCLVAPIGVLAPGSTIPPTFQPHLGRGVWEFTSRSQLRDSPGFAPVFPFGTPDRTRCAFWGHHPDPGV
jgi:hypothetical protein